MRSKNTRAQHKIDDLQAEILQLKAALSMKKEHFASVQDAYNKLCQRDFLRGKEFSGLSQQFEELKHQADALTAENAKYREDSSICRDAVTKLVEEFNTRWQATEKHNAELKDAAKKALVILATII